MAPIRYFVRFEKADGSESVIFKSNRYEYEQQQALALAGMPLVGESYSFDNQGTQPAIKSNASERVRFMNLGENDVIDDDIDNFKRIVDWGIGKIITTGASGERWAWGRPTDMPNLSFTVEQVYFAPIIMTFERSSDFYALAHDQSFDVSNPSTIEVINLGNANALDPVLIIKGPATNPKIVNSSVFLPGSSTLNYQVETTTDLAASTDWLKFDAQRNEVMLSHNSGVTWIDDAVNAVLQSGQVRMMLLKAGSNLLVVTGVTGDVEVEWTDTWH